MPSKQGKVINLNKVKRLRELIQQAVAAGWSVRANPDADLLDNNTPVIYLCDVKSGKMILLTYAVSIETVYRDITDKFPEASDFKNNCDALGTCLECYIEGQENVDTPQGMDALLMLAALYIHGTESYRMVAESGIERQQFLVLRYYHASDKIHLLRPNPILYAEILKTAELEGLVDQVLAIDRARHPERFRTSEVIPFRCREQVEPRQ